MTSLAGHLRSFAGPVPGSHRNAAPHVQRTPPAHAVIESWPAWSARDPLAAGRWDHLAQFASTPNPFFERWFLQPALEALDPHGRIKLVRIERAGELIGLLPVERTPRYSRWPIPHLASWLHPNCFVGAPLVQHGEEVAFWQALLACADSRTGTALFLHLAAMPLDTRLADALFATCAAQRRRIALVRREERAMLASTMAPSDYLTHALPGKKRKELRRQHARLAELGTVATVRQDDAQGIHEWIGEFLSLEARGWKGREGSALAAAPGTTALFRRALTEAAARGKLERLSLTLDGRPIAMLTSFLCPPGAFSFKTAFDEDYARFSPGVLLQLENLAMLDRKPIDWTDSCAATDHPMIDSLWEERRPVGRLSVAIGGALRRALFGKLADVELGRLRKG
jgi:CelD/BcsL family acetyltransferase involved in cellulose biosynthesis